MSGAKVLSRTCIKALIAQGQLIVISGKFVLRLDKWIDRHLGGRLPILHIVGKDASGQILVYHSPEVLKQMRAYRIGVINELWINFEPPISGGVFNLGDQDETIQPVPANNAIGYEPHPAVESCLQDGDEETHCSKPCPDDTLQRLRSEGIGLAPLSDCDRAYLTNKKLWFIDMSSVSDALKHCSLKYDAENFIEHVSYPILDVDLSEYPSLDTETQ